MRVVHNSTELDTRMLVTIIHAGIMRNLHSVNLNNRSYRRKVEDRRTRLRGGTLAYTVISRNKLTGCIGQCI